MLDSPIRIPLPKGDWLYLRGWHRMFGGWNRSWMFADHVFVAQNRHMFPPVEGEGYTGYLHFNTDLDEELDFLNSIRVSGATQEEAASALDDALVALGAEPVPEGEWPENCVGKGAPGNKPPHLPPYL